MAFNSDPNYWLALGQSLNQMAYAPINPNANAAAPMQAYQKSIADQNAAAKAQNAQELTQNKTLAWLQQNDPEAYQYAQAGLPVNDAFKYAVQKRQQASAPKKWYEDYKQVGDKLLGPPGQDGKPTVMYEPGPDPKEAEKQKLEAAKLEADTNKMYRGEDPVKQYEGVKFGYEKLRSAATQDTGPADISMVFGFMKMLDPTSVVREGEAANIQNTSGVPDKVRIMYNQALSGVKLSPQQRAEILQTADAVYQEASTNLQDRNKYYQDYSTRSGINPGFVMQPETFPKLELGAPAVAVPGMDGVTIRKSK